MLDGAHVGGVLVVTPTLARLVDVEHNHGEGLSLQAAHALTNNPRRARWFDAREDGSRRRLTLNTEGVNYHRQLVARRECTCRGGARA